MSVVRCRRCDTHWSATVQPLCPVCLLESWLASPDLVTPKHHPEHRSAVHDDYRSILAPEVLDDLRATLAAAVVEGTWYYNTEYEKFNHVTRRPMDRKPGAGLHAGSTNPDRHLDDLVVADADRAPHVFADHRDETRRKITKGVYLPLETCSRSKCDNLRTPGEQKCAIHTSPPLANVDR